MIQISDNFTFRKLLKFTFPSIIMMVFTSIYTIVDGFFVSNFAGKIQFTALNFVYPITAIFGSIGFMFGTGGSALIGKTLGEGNKEKANNTFSLIIFVSLGLSIVFSILGILVLKPVSILFGATGELLHYSIIYGVIILMGTPALVLQYEFTSFFPTAGKPHLGLYITLGAGFTNIILDALFVAVFHWELAGAALATIMSYIVGGLVPLFYFFSKNSSTLKIGKAKFDGKALVQTCFNGFSELLNNISMAIVGMLYNVQLLKYAGEDGVAAYGVLMYVNFVFISIFIGYAVGCAPLFSYNYGAKNHAQLHSLLKKSFVVIFVCAIGMFVLAESIAKPLTIIFVGYDQALLDLTIRGFFITAFAFLFAGFSIFGSSFFTALNNGLISGIISVSRTLIFQVFTVLLLPLVWGIDGIWVSVAVAELLSLIVAFIYIVVERKRYGY